MHMTPKEVFQNYFDYVLDNTESSSIYHRWCLLSVISATLGKRVSLDMGHFKIYGNMYVQLVGPPGIKKSSAISNAVKLLTMSGFNKFAPNQVTQGAFLEILDKARPGFGEQTIDLDLSGIGSNPLPTESKIVKTKKQNVIISTDMFIPADEWTTFIRTNTGVADFLAQLGTLWDCPDVYLSPTKTAGSTTIHHPYIVILSGNTPKGWERSFKDYSMEEGILTRMLIVSSTSNRQSIAFPEPLPENKRKVLVDMLSNTRRIEGVVKITTEAKDLLSFLYTGWRVECSAAMLPYYGRRYTHLLKMCLIVASACGDLVVTRETVIVCNTILALTEKMMARCVDALYAETDINIIKSSIISYMTNNEEDNFTSAQLYVALQLTDVGKHQDALASLIKDGRIILQKQYYMLKPNKFPPSLMKYIDTEILQPDELRELSEDF